MLAAFLAAFVRTEWALKIIIGSFLLAMLKLGQEGFVGWYTGGMVWENQGIPRLHGVTSLYRHPNSYSGMAVGCLPFIFYLLPVSKPWQRAILLVLLIFCLIIIVFTGSRTGYVATTLLAIYFWKEKLTKIRLKHILIGALIPIAIYFFMPNEYIQRFVSIFTLEEAEGASSRTRIQILEDAIFVFFNYPWGVGVGAFPAVRMDLFNRYQDTHNLYLEILTNLSIVGLITFFYLIYRVIKINKNIIKMNDTSQFITAISKAIIAFIYARLFLGLFGMDTYEIYWWFAVGLTIAIIKITDNKKIALSQQPVYKQTARDHWNLRR